MKEESLLLLSDLQKLINQVVLIDYTIIILGGTIMKKIMLSLLSYTLATMSGLCLVGGAAVLSYKE